MSAELVVVHTTVEGEADADALAARLVEASLAACVQHFPVRSTYRWKGKLERTAEHLLLIKTPAARLAALRRFLEEHHPYEVPEIVVTPVTEVSAAYARWVHEQTGP